MDGKLGTFFWLFFPYSRVATINLVFELLLYIRGDIVKWMNNPKGNNVWYMIFFYIPSYSLVVILYYILSYTESRANVTYDFCTGIYIFKWKLF